MRLRLVLVALLAATVAAAFPVSFFSVVARKNAGGAGPTPLADLIEYLIDEVGGTNAAGLVDDTSGNDYDGTPVGLTWIVGTNDVQGSWRSANDGGDWILSTNDSTLADYVMVMRSATASGNWPYQLLWPEVNGSFYVTTNATSIKWGDGSSSEDPDMGNCFAFTTAQTDAQRDTLWFTVMTNFGLPMWYYDNRDEFSNLVCLTTFSGDYANLGTMTNVTGTSGAVGSPANMSIVNGIGDFNGSSAYVTLDEETLYDQDNTASITITAWINPSSMAGDTIYSKQVAGGNNNGFWFRVETGDKLGFIVSKDNSPVERVFVYSPVASLTNGVWQHVAVTWLGGTAASGVTFYIDGIKRPLTIVNDTLNGSILNNVNPQWGARGAGQFFDGSMDQCTYGVGVMASNKIFSLASEAAPE